MEKTNPTPNLPRIIEISLQGNKYAINFPNIGQLIDIEVKKVAYAKNLYSPLVMNGTVSAGIALDFIDSIAVFSVMIPNFNDNLNVKSILELSPIDTIELTTQYKKVWAPWFEKWIEVMKQAEEELSATLEGKK